MHIIKLKSWQTGITWKPFVRLQQNLLGLGLKEAKENYDALLKEGAQGEIKVESIEIALEFITRAKEIGAICELESESPPTL